MAKESHQPGSPRYLFLQPHPCILSQAAPLPSFPSSWALLVIKFTNEFHMAGVWHAGDGLVPDTVTALSPGCFLLFLPECRSEVRPGVAIR